MINFPTVRVCRPYNTLAEAKAEADRLNALPALYGWTCADSYWTLKLPEGDGWRPAKFSAEAKAMPYDGKAIVEFNEPFKNH